MGSTETQTWCQELAVVHFSTRRRRTAVRLSRSIGWRTLTMMQKASVRSDDREARQTRRGGWILLHICRCLPPPTDDMDNTFHFLLPPLFPPLPNRCHSLVNLTDDPPILGRDSSAPAASSSPPRHFDLETPPLQPLRHEVSPHRPRPSTRPYWDSLLKIRFFRDG